MCAYVIGIRWQINSLIELNNLEIQKLLLNTNKYVKRDNIG